MVVDRRIVVNMGAGASAAGASSLLAAMGETVTEEELREVAGKVGLDADSLEDWLSTVKDFAEFPIPKERIERQCVAFVLWRFICDCVCAFLGRYLFA